MNYVQECCCLGIGVTGLFPEAFESDEAHLSSFSCVARLPDYEALETYLPLDGKIFNDGDANSIFTQNNISSKFSFSAKIIDIEQNGIIFIVKILVNNNIAMITMDNDALNYKIGDEILVSTKAFNPIVFKI